MQDLYNRLTGHRFGGIFQSRIATLLIRDPEIIKILFVKDFQNFPDRGIRTDEENYPLAANLFNLEGKRRRHLRIKLTPVFTSGKIKIMFNLVHKCAQDLTK
jgi:cytochrome P450 family 6